MSRARPHLVTVGLACALWLLPGIASADWFDDYERGVAALAKGRPERAIPLLEKTIRRRPEPGSNLITYGTNRLKEYYPYLKLAEAHLALGNLDAAGAALERSETNGKEPADARASLQARWREAVKAEEARAQPPPPPVEPPKPTTTAAPTPPPPVASRTGTLVVRSQPTSGASVLANDRFLGVTPLTVELDVGEYVITVRKEGAPPERISVRVKAGETNVLNQRLILPEPKPAPAPVRRPDPEPTKPRVEPPSLVIVTDPPGTSVYLDDELIGSTDPKTRPAHAERRRKGLAPDPTVAKGLRGPRRGYRD
ncbi:MAG: PEGA domain-containing protein [Acidobacteria bacterium]|nr:MAG: PEGA domain-containing protein [Acidobacteriota bacterium]